MWQFWTDWKHMTAQERRAAAALTKARSILIREFGDELIAVFVGGSFLRREMNENSDVDTWSVLKESKPLAKLNKLDQTIGHEFNPIVSLSGFSLWELYSGKRSKQGKKFKTHPGRFVKNLQNFKQIYGSSLPISTFKVRTDRQDLAGTMNFIETTFLKMYENGEFGFGDVLKLAVYCVESELKIRGINTKYSWKLYAKVLPKNHIMQTILSLREHPTKSKTVRKLFIRQLIKYLNKLKREFLMQS